MTMLAVRSPPLEAWPAQLIATRAAAGGRPSARAGPDRGRRAAPAQGRPGEGGRRERPGLHPERRAGARVRQQGAEAAGALVQVAQQRDGQQQQAERAQRGQRPPGRPPRPRPPGQRRLGPAPDALGLGRRAPGRRHPAAAQGRLDDGGRHHHQAQHPHRRDQQQQPGGDRQRAVAAVARRAARVAVLREGPPLHDHPPGARAQEGRHDGVGVPRVAPRGARHDRAAGTGPRLEPQERLLDRRRQHQPHGPRPHLQRALLRVGLRGGRGREARHERRREGGPGTAAAHVPFGGPPARS